MTKTYDDIKDLLSTKKLPELSGHGATAEEIKAAEKQLSVHFPVSFRRFLKEHGWGYFGSLELIVGLGSDIPKEWEAGTNIVHVVSDERKGPLNFPHNVIPICQNGAGDWYALDCTHIDSGECPLVFVSHEKVASDGFDAEVCAQNFAAWIFSKLSEDQ